MILDLCGGTGAWSKPYREAGYNVQVVSLPQTDTRLWPSPSSHTARLPSDFDDIADFRGRVRGILAAPPCTVFSGSGARWPRTDDEIHEGLSVVDACLRIIWAVQPAWWALENPVGKLRKWIGPPLMSFDPCDYGDPYTKRSHLWGEFQPPEKAPVEPTEGSKLWRNYGGKSERTKRERSITPPGFAQAFFEANR